MYKKRTFRAYLKKRLADPEFKKYYEEEIKNLQLGYQIQQARKKSGLTQKQLAARIGSSQGAITRLESGNYTSYTVKTLEKIAAAFGGKLYVELQI